MVAQFVLYDQINLRENTLFQVNFYLANMISIVKNHIVIHHSHATGKIIRYAHNFCNLRRKENYYTIPILAHDQFRFDLI